MMVDSATRHYEFDEALISPLDGGGFEPRLIRKTGGSYEYHD
jgi:hypothetical protein